MASRMRRSASTLSWSGGDGGDLAADTIFVAQSQQEERVAWGGRCVEATKADFGVRGSVEWRLWLFEYESGKCESEKSGVCRVGFLNFCFYSLISFSLIIFN